MTLDSDDMETLALSSFCCCHLKKNPDLVSTVYVNILLMKMQDPLNHFIRTLARRRIRKDVASFKHYPTTSGHSKNWKKKKKKTTEGRKDQRTKQQLNINACNVITANLGTPKHMFAHVRARVPVMKMSRALSCQPHLRL